jgi:predicted MFS family arabinose efflux permease
MSTPVVEALDQRAEDEKPHLVRWAVIIGAGVLATTLSQPAVLKIPFQNLLKNDLHVSRQVMAAFFAIVPFAWNIKPLFGIISDSTPIFGTRRRHYLLIGSASAAALWLLIGFVPRNYMALLIATTAMSSMLVIGSTVSGALMVEAGQRYNASGRLSSARYLVQNFCVLTGGPLGGFLAAKAFGFTAITGALISFSVFPIAFFMLKEPRTTQKNSESIRKAKEQFFTLMKSGTLWAAAGMLFFVYFAPGFATPLYYYQTDTLKFSQQFIGNLAFINGGIGLLGAVLYGTACRKLSLRQLMYIAIAVNAVLTLSFLFYTSPTHAMFIEAQNGFVGTLAELAMMDMAVRATPKGCEGMGFSLMMSVRNTGLGVSDILGSRLIEHYHFTFFNLVWLNAGTTALVLVVIPFLPKLLMDRSDIKTA